MIRFYSDFHTHIAVENASAPSVIRIRIEGLKAHELALMIKNVTPLISEQLSSGAMVTIDEKSVRVRKIPLTDHLSVAP